VWVIRAVIFGYFGTLTDPGDDITGAVMPASASRGTTRSASWRNSGGGGSGSAC
jgi:hypothetical protein